MRYHRSLAAVVFLAAVGGFALHWGGRQARALPCQFNVCSVIHAWQDPPDQSGPGKIIAAFAYGTQPKEANRTDPIHKDKAILTGKGSLLTSQDEQGTLTDKGVKMTLYRFPEFNKDCTHTAPAGVPVVGLESGPASSLDSLHNNPPG